MAELLDNAHHSIMLITGARKRVCCPECGSDKYYKTVDYIEGVEEFTDGHEVRNGLDWHSTTWNCEDCDYNYYH